MYITPSTQRFRYGRSESRLEPKDRTADNPVLNGRRNYGGRGVPKVPTSAKRLFQRVRGMVHPFIESFAPVTYTDHEIITRKRQLDPTDARNDPRENVDTDRRVWQLANAWWARWRSNFDLPGRACYWEPVARQRN